MPLHHPSFRPSSSTITTIPTSGNVRNNNSPHRILQIPDARTVHYQSQQAIPPFQIQPIHNHGQETIPNTAQNFDQNAFQNLVIELQAVKEEVNYFKIISI